jgi:hypothetical protein
VLNNSACQLYLQQIDKEFPTCNMLYIDVDGVVRSDPWPLLRTLSCDIAAYVLRGEELLSGTLYLPAGPKRTELLTRWVDANGKNPQAWDQANLQALLEGSSDFRFERLPAEYCCIFDIQRLHTPNIIPVVEHFQASRRYKKRAK